MNSDEFSLSVISLKLNFISTGPVDFRVEERVRTQVVG